MSLSKWWILLFTYQLLISPLVFSKISWCIHIVSLCIALLVKISHLSNRDIHYFILQHIIFILQHISLQLACTHIAVNIHINIKTTLTVSYFLISLKLKDQFCRMKNNKYITQWKLTPVGLGRKNNHTALHQDHGFGLILVGTQISNPQGFIKSIMGGSMHKLTRCQAILLST